MIANIELEQAILGAILVNNDCFPVASARIVADDFDDPVHRRIYERCAARIARDHIASPATLKADLDGDEGLAQLGGPPYLARLAGAAISLFAIKDYADQLAAIGRKRRLAALLTEQLEALANPDKDAAAVLGAIEAYGLAQEGKGGAEIVPFKAAILTALEDVKAAYEGDTIPGTPLGIGELDRLTGGLFPGDLVIIGGRPSMGKAQPLDAQVLTTTGWRRMGEIKVGDNLASIDGQRCLVSGVFPQGRRPVFRITFSDGRSTRACGEHLWSVTSSKFEGVRVLSTDKIAAMLTQERYRRRLSVPTVSGDFGEDVDLPVDPWLLGALIGNGNLTKATPRISTADAATLWRIQEALGERQSLRASGDYDYTIRGVRQVNDLADGLRDLGLMDHLSHEKFIPPSYLNASKGTRLELLRGLMDTDGWVETFGAVRYSTSSPQLAADVANLVRSLGAVCSTSSKIPHYTKNSERIECREHFILNIRHDDAKSFFSLARKARLAKRGKPVRLTIKSIEPAGVEDVQCIAVTHPSRLYVTDDFIVTHNTGLALSGALGAARAGKGVAVASLEMTAGSLALRAISEASARRGSPVPYTDARRGAMDEDGLSSLLAGAGDILNLPIQIIPPHVRDIGAIYAATKRAAKQLEAKGAPLSMLVVDYLQLIRSSKQSRIDQITEISMALKGLAMQLQIPVVALSQLSRAVESRDDKRPVMSDLRESGQLEQDADLILFCYRDEYYLRREGAPKDGTSEEIAEYFRALDAATGVMDVIVAKQRMGDIGDVRVLYDPATNLIQDHRA